MFWRGDEYLEGVQAKVTRNVEAACIHVQNTARENISTPSRTVTEGVFSRGPRIGQAKKVLGPRGSNRSLPGEFPHKDFGTLRASVAHAMKGDEPAGLVGTALNYGKFLELGTAKMAPRPWLRRTLIDETGRIVEIVTKL